MTSFKNSPAALMAQRAGITEEMYWEGAERERGAVVRELGAYVERSQARGKAVEVDWDSVHVSGGGYWRAVVYVDGTRRRAMEGDGGKWRLV